MTNFDTAREALETSLNSAGSAMQEHEKWQQSLESRILSLKASWQALSQSFMDSNFLRGALEGVIKLVDGITKLIDTFGTLPTLVGTVAAGFSAFKNQGLFKFDKDAQSIKLLGTQLTGLKGKYTEIHTAIDRYNSLSSKSASFQERYNKQLASSTTSVGKYLQGLNGAKASFGGYISSLVGATVKTIALEAATIALNAALTMGISFAIQGIITLFDKMHVSASELSEEVEELTSKFQEEHNELTKLKGDYDTSNESSMISKYAKLSKGVDSLGRNVSLTADEYSEYQGIVNKIAEQIPSLVSGYDEQGNALLSCKDNVESLTQAYEDMISAQNRAILNNAGKIGEDFANAVEENESTGWKGDRLSVDVVDEMERAMSGAFKAEKYDPTTLQGYFFDDAYAVKVALEKAGLADFGRTYTIDQVREAFYNAAKTNPKRVQSIIDEFRAGLEADTAEMKNIAQATLSEAFDISDSEYYDMSDTMQSVARNIVNGFDYEFYKQYKDNPLGVQTYINHMLKQLKSMSDVEGVVVETAFNLKTQFNNGEISYGDYVEGLKNAGQTIDRLQLDEEIKNDIKLSIGLNEKGLVEEYESLVKKLSDSKNYDFKISETEAQDFINSLSSEELAIAVDVITQMQNNGVEETVDEIRNAIETEIAKRGLSLDLTIEKAKLNFEALSTAISESVSGSGLSEESIAAVKGMFEGLEGYNPSKLFERTANGIHLNSTELRKLNDESKKTNVAKVNKQMNSLGDIYNQTREQLYQLTYGTEEYNDKLSDLNYIEQQIKDLEKLAAGYDGVASAYQEWQMLESAGSQRSMYEGILEGWENVEDEISRGWIDDGTREFLELLKGEKATIIDGDGNKKEINIATASAKDLKKVWKSLDDTIKHTTYSVEDFFTVDDEGNSTSKGVYNFLDAIGQMEEEKFGGKDVVKRDNKGNIIGFDFQMVGGDKVIAEALGISEELVQIMKRASADAGFVVTLDGSFEQLDILREKAQKASEVLNKALKNKGQADKVFSYNFNSTDEKDITNQLAKANKALNTFKKSGKIDLSIEGASEALTVTSTLQSMLDNLQRPAYMQIEVSQVEKDLQTPLRNLQELRTLTETEHQFKISGADTSELEKSKQEIYNYFETLDADVKVKLGLVDDKGNPLTGQALKDKLNSGDIAIEATIDIQMEMDEKLGILVDKALYDAGIIDKEEFTKRVNVYLEADVDNKDTKDKVENATEEVSEPSVVEKDIELVTEVVDSDVDEKVKGALDKDRERATERREHNIEIIAKTLGVEDVDNLSSKLKNLDDKTIQAIAEVLGNVEVDKLKLALGTMTDVQIKAIAEAIGKGDVDALKTAIGNLDSNTVQAIVEAFGYNDVNELIGAIDNLDPKTVQAVAQALGLGDVNTLQITVNNMQGNTVDAKVNTDGQASKVDTLQTKINSLKGKIVTVGVQLAKGGKKKAAQRTGADPAGNDSEVNGTANINGTTGRAFKQGDWRTKRAETALTGELGREIVVTPQNRWYTVGDNGAEFVNIPRGSIVFNHRQTEELLKNGKATSDGGRARALVNGTAFLSGTAHRGYGEWIAPEVESFKVGYDYDNKDSDKSQEIFDWIEIAIERIEREIDNFDQKANNVYKSWSSRNSALADQINMVGNEIALQRNAIKGYQQALNEIGLDQGYIDLIEAGTIKIENITNETIAEKVKDYQKWYEKILQCEDAILELQETESALYRQRFDNVATQYEAILQGFDHTQSMLDEYINQAEAKGYIVSKKYYDALIDNEENRISKLKQEQSALIAARNEAEANGIARNSQAWMDMCADIDEVTQAIEAGTTALIEYNNAIRDIDFEQFELIQERISDITEEANFLIDLMSYDKLFDDNGKLTDKGMATMGLHGQNINTYMYQADDYGAKVKEIDNKIASGELDGYSRYVIDKRREYVELQREAILNAEQEKQAIKDLVEEGINLELDALQERIDLHNEELDSMRDLYDYQKNVQEQTENIASLQKQLKAYEGFNDEETRATVQKLKLELEEANADLEETQYDKYIADQSALLDELFLEYENVLNTRLDDTNGLITQVIDAVNIAAGAEGTIATALGAEGAIAKELAANGVTIKSTLETEAKNVGTTLSTAMKGIWSVDEGNAKSVITEYGKGFQDKQTTTNTVLGDIKAYINRMVDDVDKDATTKVNANKTTTSAKKNPTTTTTNANKNTTTTNNNSSSTSKITDDTIKGIAAAIWIYGKNSGWGNNPFRENKLSNKIGASNAKKVQDYVNKYGSNGILYNFWIKNGKNLDKYKYNAFKLGAKDIDETQLAWTQEQGQEFIVRPSDGAILTPVAKGDSVLTSAASNNIWDMANSPAEFIKDNLNLGITNAPNNSTVQSQCVQNFENITFSMPNVRNYEQLLSEMQKDKSFEKLIMAMTVDRIAGGSFLAKNKSIRK